MEEKVEGGDAGNHFEEGGGDFIVGVSEVMEFTSSPHHHLTRA